MRRWIKYLPILLVVAAALTWYVIQASRVHRPVEAADVAEVQVRIGNSEQMTLAQPGQAAQIIAWFNGAAAIKNNPSHAGPGCSEGHRVVIRLRSGERISLWRYGDRLHVQRGDDDYYFSQPDLLKLIKELQQGKSTGC